MGVEEEPPKLPSDLVPATLRTKLASGGTTDLAAAKTSCRRLL